MFKKAAIALALILFPAVASAQHHQHSDAAKKAQHDHAKAASAEHVNFPQLLMEKRAELKLTDEQIAKLEDISARMAQHHAEMKKAGAKHDHAAGSKLHDELLAIFTEDQLAKVRPLMKDHMAGKCAAEDKECKVEAKKKAPVQ